MGPAQVAQALAEPLAPPPLVAAAAAPYVRAPAPALASVPELTPAPVSVRVPVSTPASRASGAPRAQPAAPSVGECSPLVWTGGGLLPRAGLVKDGPKTGFRGGLSCVCYRITWRRSLTHALCVGLAAS